MAKTAQKGAGENPAPYTKRKRSAKRYTIHLTIFLVFALASGITLCLTEFFLITSIQVEGNDRYSNGEVIEVSGILLEDNLFRTDTKTAQERIVSKYPYFETVQIKRILPESVIVQVTMAQPMIALETEEGYVLVSSQGKILETDLEEADEELLRVRGLEDWDYQVGSFINDYVEGDEQSEVLTESYAMLKAFKEAENVVQLGNINYLDLSDRYNICALYDNRILLELGSEAKLEYKLNFIAEMLKENIPRDFGEDFEGVIDASFDKMLRVRPMDLSQMLDDRALAGALLDADSEDDMLYGSDMQPMIVPVRLGEEDEEFPDEDTIQPDEGEEDEAIFESSVKPKEE